MDDLGGTGAERIRADAPKFLFVQINQRCNLRCQHCNFWKLTDDDRPNYLPWPRRREILEEYAAMSPGARVVTCGGEPMLDPDELFGLTRECRRLGLRCLSVMNGSRIDEAMAARLIGEGPHEVSISLNSPRDEVHGRTRGDKASFRLAVAALRSLLAQRSLLSAHDSRVYAMALVCEQTYRDLDRFYDLVLNDIGADKLKLNILQPTFGKVGLDPFFAANAIANHEELAAILRACDVKYKLGLNPVWIEQVKMYFRSMARNQNAIQGWAVAAATDEHICNSYERNIMLDLYGTARLCFSHDFPGVKLENPGDLRRFWYEQRPDICPAMRTCNRYCGISHSVRRENATLRTPIRQG